MNRQILRKGDEYTMAEKKREDGQSELFGFIDSVQDKMDKIRDDFFRKWNAVIKRYLRQGDDFHIEYFIDICGGYWLQMNFMNRWIQN